MIKEIIGSPDFWKYLSIPAVAALVGWSTNWVAIKLLFYPIHPVGRPPFFGWQGILPSKAAKMGIITSRTTVSKLGSLKDVFEAMKPEKIADHLIKAIKPRIEDYVEWIMLEENPGLWKTMPDMVKIFIYVTVRERLPQTLRNMMRDIAARVESMVDLEQVVVKQVERNPELINRIFLECGRVEFRFIIKSGLYFGFLFGLLQMGGWVFYPTWWILPLFGAMVGYATNWIALRIIFQPLNPQRIGPFIVQGLFLKRQKEVADIWSDIVTREVITVHNVMEDMLYGSKSENTHQVIRKYIREIVDEALGIAKPIVEFTIGIKELQKIKESASQKGVYLTASAFEEGSFSKERAGAVKEMIRQRMDSLSTEEFQYLLRPAFQEDEFKLIIMGAVLGLMAGLGQLFLVFGGGTL